MAEQTREVRKDLPPVLWVRVEVRQIISTPWQAFELPQADLSKAEGR